MIKFFLVLFKTPFYFAYRIKFVMDVLIFWKLNKHLKNILWIIEYWELPQNIKTFMFSTT